MGLEEEFATIFGGLDCSSYVHSELCYYLLELVYEDLKSKKRLSDLQRLLEEVAAAIGELLEGQG